MLPGLYSDNLTSDFTIKTRTSNTYRVNFGAEQSTGKITGLEALKQAIFLMLHTERYCHEIYSWNFGTEFRKLMGTQNDSRLQIALKKAISESLIQDDRITAVQGFVFERNGKKLTVTFNVESTEGEITGTLDWWGEEGWEVVLR